VLYISGSASSYANDDKLLAMILKIYLICIIAGLLYPVIDGLLIRYSKIYIAADFLSGAIACQAYRTFSVKSKLSLAVIPVVNSLWILVLGAIAFFFIREWWFGRKKAFIWWLAGTSTRHHFVFKTKLVKKLFPSYINYYYLSLEQRHYNYKLAKDLSRILLKIAGEAMEKQKSHDQVLCDALEMTEQFKKKENAESKG
jgi:intracellular septation protein A